MLCDGFTGMDLISRSLDTSANASAYFGRKEERSLFGVINKSPSNLSLTVGKGASTHKPLSATLLTAPSLDAKHGVTERLQTGISLDLQESALFRLPLSWRSYE